MMLKKKSLKLSTFGLDRVMFFFADLCHRRRDVHRRRDHRLVYIYCLRSLEEDPDWKDVMRVASQPRAYFIYKCKVASLLAKSTSD